MPLVSILIPTLRATWLDAAIGSALAQTFGDFELIVSDDSTGDEVEKTVAKWSDPRLRYVKNPTRGKPGTNRDLLIGLARGDYIKFLFDDDVLYPHSLEMLLAMLRASGCKLAFHSRDVIDSQGRIIARPRFAVKPERREVLRYARFKLRREFVRHWPSRGANYRPRDFEVLSSAYFFETMIGSASNAIGEPSNILIDAQILRGTSEPFLLGGRRMRFLTDMALYTNVMARGFGIVGTAKVGSAFRKHDLQASGRNYPGYSAGLFEWELIGRWAVDAGKLSSAGFERLRSHVVATYRDNVEVYSELDEFIALPTNGQNAPRLDEQFDRVLSNAYRAIDKSKATI